MIRSVRHGIRQLLLFGWLEALSCLFPVLIFISLAVLKTADVPHMYDLMLVICLLIQWAMVRTGLETRDEVKVICLFHLIGLALEIYKVNMGSWSYPEEAWTKVWGVPLYSGFMYASVASYLCQAWRRLHVELTRWPSPWFAVPLGAAIYLNFMTHHYIWDLRWVLTVLLFVLFFRTAVLFTVGRKTYRMPLVLSFFLIGFFIWLAENIATFLGAWQYPNQRESWQLVSFGKMSSWFLLVIVSFLIVAQLKRVKQSENKPDGRMAPAAVPEE
ncbi:DUF817 domain-containing protein [Paenibacillus sp. RC84]|uniref:DUF817 domain-containing protein n=1 Tax=Paenibacillus sp. RC84 TaxID=3156252 RepID=UPI0035186DB2